MLRMLCCGLALSLATLPGCTEVKRRPSTQNGNQEATVPKGPAPKLRLIAVTDLSGYLEPCGCQSVPLGGIDKAAAELDRLAADGAPALFVSVGDLFFEPVGGNHATTHDDAGEADASTQQRWQAETLAGVLKRMGLVAAVPGPADFNHGPEVLAKLTKHSGATLLSATTGEVKGLSFVAKRMVERGGLKVGLWGLSDFGGETAPEGLPKPAEDLVAEAQRLTAELRAEGAQVVVGLLRADARSARRLAGKVEKLDFLVHGGLSTHEVPVPERIGSPTFLRAGYHGQGLLVVDLHPAAQPREPAFEDASQWTREAKRDGLGREIETLTARIATWEKEGQDAKLIAEQKARMQAMGEQRAALEKPVSLEAGGVFDARYVKLTPKVGGAATIRTVLEAHDARVNEHNRTALAHVAPPPVPEGKAGYVGSERCGDCHAAALSWWEGHRHGNAYATLEMRNKQFNLSCVGCHVTGYHKPGGATVVQNEGLTDVGCESCHGPGSLHVKDRKAPAEVNVVRTVPESTCLECHVPEHSDRFEYNAYKAMLMAPGHGLPAKGGT